MSLFFKKTIVVIFAILFLTLPMLDILANTEPYTLLAPLPLTGDRYATETRLPEYVNGIIRIAIGISAVFAILMIIIGGFQYMTSDAIQGKQDGKNRIKNAFWGIILIAGAFIILNTINPRLLDINLNIERIQTREASVDGGTLGGRGVCTTCAPVDPDLPLKPGQGTQILPDTNTKLVSLDGTLKAAGISWQITEAYPPRVAHANQCHNRGTCVDANFVDRDRPRTDDLENLTPEERRTHANNINRFIAGASNSGLRAQYEVPTVARKNLLVQAGVPSNRITVVPTLINNRAIVPHFSVYNCSADPQSCRTLP